MSSKSNLHESDSTPQRLIIARITYGLLLLGLAPLSVDAQPPAPPTNVKVVDVPNDNGTALELQWTLSSDDNQNAAHPVVKYQVVQHRERAQDSKSGYFYFFAMIQGSKSDQIEVQFFDLPAGTSRYLAKGCDPSYFYDFAIQAVGLEDSKSDSVLTAATRPVVNWFDSTKTAFATLVAAVCATVILCTEIARRGRPFYVRPIAGLLAIEEAVGRATEMGKPLLFVPGIEDVKEIDTVAGLMVLSSVARTAAEYDTPLEVPTTRTLVMTAARETVQAAALVTGHPDYYNEDRIYYVTEEQFGYVASVCGWMQREKPAACFFLGKFFAESLILAETGNSVGAIQIAGTAEATQLPFFVAACDYTLLGEELFAASAYLSGEPAQLGMVKGQDFGKLAAMVLIVTGCALSTMDSVFPPIKDSKGIPQPPRVSIITNWILSK